MATRPLFGLCLAALLLAGAPLVGCGKSELTETTIPAEGIELRYDLEPGATFEGHVRRRETISVRGQPMTRSIDFRVQLVVNEVEDDGTARVAATVGNIDLNWVIPGMPISMNEFNQRAKARLEGVTIRFGVTPEGEVIDVPPAPPELEQNEVEVLNTVIEGLTSAFFEVPEERLTATQGWEQDSTRGREGKLGKYTEELVRGALEGFYIHRETGQKLAKLEIDGDKTETTTTKDGSSEIRTRRDVSVLWDVDNSYMAAIDSNMTRTQGPSTTKVQFIAEWTRSIAGSSGAGAGAESGSAEAEAEPDATKVQAITDPCDDNYVGPEECLDPCNVNYMGDEPCKEDAPEAEAAEAAEGAEAAEAAEEAEAAEAESDG